MLGMMTTIHPCPMTANIAAISFLSGDSRNKKKQFFTITYFALGYMFALAGIASLINFSLISIPRLSTFLQSVLSAFVGPMLILAGMAVSGMINLNRPFMGVRIDKEHWKKKPAIYIITMGALLALTFCPATAFIYFGIMIPLSINSDQIILFPILFAIGALLPIAAISIMINHGFLILLKEKWAKKLPSTAGGILILTGIYITVAQLYF
jgi:hypothetical protein